MTELGLGGCLADDMGLGKTIQVIDLLLMHANGWNALLLPSPLYSGESSLLLSPLPCTRGRGGWG